MSSQVAPKQIISVMAQEDPGRNLALNIPEKSYSKITPTKSLLAIQCIDFLLINAVKILKIERILKWVPPFCIVPKIQELCVRMLLRTKRCFILSEAGAQRFWQAHWCDESIEHADTADTLHVG